MTDEPRRAILYLRISRDVRGEEEGVERQEHAGRRLATDRGWDLTEVIVDNDTSAKGHRNRAGWLRMLAMLRDGSADTIIGQDITRCLRNGRDRVDLIELGKARNLIIALFKGGYFDLGTASGRLLIDMLGAAALNEIELKSERQIFANLQAVRDGKPPTRRAFGYPGTDQRPASFRQHLPTPPEVVAAEAEAVRMLFAGALAGDSISGLARKMALTGLTTTRGKPWSRPMIRQLLTNPRYGGLRAYKGEVQGPGAWEPLVPLDEWRAVQQIISDPARATNTRRSTARLHLLGGLALCGICDDGTTVKTTYGSSGEGRKYTCRKTKHLARRADYIDDYVREVMIAWASSPAAAEYLAVQAGPDLAALRTEAATLTMRLDQAAESFADGLISQQQMTAASTRLRTRLAEVEQTLQAALARTTLGPLVGPQAAAVWEAMSLDRRRHAIRLAVTVTLLPRGADGRPVSSRFDPGLIRIAPVSGGAAPD